VIGMRIIKRHYEKLGVGGNERTDDEKKVTKMNKDHETFVKSSPGHNDAE